MRSDLVGLSHILELQSLPITKVTLQALRRRIRSREVELGTRLIHVPRQGAPAQCSLSLLQTTMPELFTPVIPPPEAAVGKIFARHDAEIDELHSMIDNVKEEISELRQRDDQLLAKLEELKARLTRA